MSKKTIILYSPQMEEGGMKPRGPPLSALTLASPLLKEGYDVKIFDTLVDNKAQERVLENLDEALCVGMTVWIGYPIKDSLELARKVKQKKPNLPIVWGGWFPSLFPDKALKDDAVDIVVRGQGETTFLDLVQHISQDKSLDDVLGITYKSKNGKITTNPDRPRTSLDENPPLPFHLVSLEKYITSVLGKRTISYITSQGCVFNCTFCSDSKIYKRIQMVRSVENVLIDLKHFIENYDIDGVVFDDNNFFLNKKRLLKICEGIIQNGWNIKWSCMTRVDHILSLSKEEMILVKKSGCHMILIGAESGSQRILDFINKGIKVEDTIKASNYCAKWGIAIKLMVMVGLPKETDKDLGKTLLLIREVYKHNKNNQLLVYFYAPYHGTNLYEYAKKKYGFKEPETLEEWSKIDVNLAVLPWSKRIKKRVTTFLFYLQLAYMNNHFVDRISEPRLKFLYKILHKSALFRMENNLFILPIEKQLHDVYKKLRKNPVNSSPTFTKDY